MKIKAVGAICGKVKQIVINDQGSRQWIGDGMAAYALPDNFPEINESSACMLFDIETDKAADYYIRRQALAGFNVADDDDGEEHLDYDTDRRLIVDGKDLLPVSMPHRKTFFIQTRYLKPLKDAEQLQLFLRDAGTESPYIVAKDGMFVVAVIVPTPLKASARLWLGAIHGNAAQIRDDE